MRGLSPGTGWIVGAVLVAVVTPVGLIWRAQPPLPAVAGRGETLAPMTVDAAPEAGRRLFLDPLDPANAPAAEDAPKLVGIAGRLPDNAIAMVRAPDGTSKIVSPGQSYEGWKLESLSPDAALFSRGNRRVRSFLPTAEPEPETASEGEEGR